MSKQLVRVVLVMFAILLPQCAPGPAERPERHRRRRQRRDRRGASRRHGRSQQPGADREGRDRRTNEAGQYRIVDLRPGTYTVTFTLTGFNTVVARGHRARSRTSWRRSTSRCGSARRGNHHRHRRDPGRRRADQLAPRGVSAGSARGAPDRTQFRADGQHGARGQHGRVRRRRLERDVDRRQPHWCTGRRPATRAR